MTFVCYYNRTNNNSSIDGVFIVISNSKAIYSH